jgi:hypothetical protein
MLSIAMLQSDFIQGSFKTSRPKLQDQDFKTKTSKPRLQDQDFKTKTSRPKLQDQDFKTMRCVAVRA